MGGGGGSYESIDARIIDINLERDPCNQILKLIAAILVHNQKHASCNKPVHLLSQLVTTSRYQDVFAWLATTC